MRVNWNILKSLKATKADDEATAKKALEKAKAAAAGDAAKETPKEDKLHDLLMKIKGAQSAAASQSSGAGSKEPGNWNDFFTKLNGISAAAKGGYPHVESVVPDAMEVYQGMIEKGASPDVINDIVTRYENMIMKSEERVARLKNLLSDIDAWKNDPDYASRDALSIKNEITFHEAIIKRSTEQLQVAKDIQTLQGNQFKESLKSGIPINGMIGEFKIVELDGEQFAVNVRTEAVFPLSYFNKIKEASPLMTGVKESSLEAVADDYGMLAVGDIDLRKAQLDNLKEQLDVDGVLRLDPATMFADQANKINVNISIPALFPVQFDKKEGSTSKKIRNVGTYDYMTANPPFKMVNGGLVPNVPSGDFTYVKVNSASMSTEYIGEGNLKRPVNVLILEGEDKKVIAKIAIAGAIIRDRKDPNQGWEESIATTEKQGQFEIMATHATYQINVDHPMKLDTSSLVSNVAMLGYDLSKDIGDNSVDTGSYGKLLSTGERLFFKEGTKFDPFETDGNGSSKWGFSQSKVSGFPVKIDSAEKPPRMPIGVKVNLQAGSSYQGTTGIDIITVEGDSETPTYIDGGAGSNILIQKGDNDIAALNMGFVYTKGEGRKYITYASQPWERYKITVPMAEKELETRKAENKIIAEGNKEIDKKIMQITLDGTMDPKVKEKEIEKLRGQIKPLKSEDKEIPFFQFTPHVLYARDKAKVVAHNQFTKTVDNAKDVKIYGDPSDEGLTQISQEQENCHVFDADENCIIKLSNDTLENLYNKGNYSNAGNFSATILPEIEKMGKSCSEAIDKGEEKYRDREEIKDILKKQKAAAGLDPDKTGEFQKMSAEMNNFFGEYDNVGATEKAVEDPKW